MTRRRALVWLVVTALLVATAIAATSAYTLERREAEEENRAVARQAAAIAQQQVELLAAGLRGGEVVLRRGGELDERRFERLTADVLRETPFPALGFIELVPGDQRARVEAELGGPLTALAGSGFRRAPERRLYAPYVAVHPDDARRRELLGFDVLSNPARRQAIAAARASGRARISAPTTEAITRRPGFVIVAPVERGRGRGEVAGFFGAPVVAERLAREITRRLGEGEAVQILDGGRLLAGPQALPAGSMSETVPVLGRRWTVAASPVASTDLAPALAFAVGGLALSALATAIFWTAGRRERDLQRRRAAAELQAARESLLTRAADAIERELGLDARLQSLARVLVPAVGDACAVHAVTAERRVRLAGAAAAHPAVERVLAESGTPPATSPVRAAIASRQPVLQTRLGGARDPARVAWPPGDEAALRAATTSSMIVPLVARGRVLGTISLAILAGSERPAYTRDDLAFVGEVASHAAVALDNARLYEQQREIAGVLQGALMPRSLPRVEGLEVAARHRPGLDGLVVGGDFYDLFRVGRGWVAVVGDVCGKGPEAAALTALVRHTLRATADEGPAEAVARVHDAIRATNDPTYCTLCCVEFAAAEANGGGVRARVTTAGHPEPRIVRRDGEVVRLSVTGPLVGGFDSARFGAEAVTLEPGDLLFICSDGLPEARRGSEVFGDERLERLLARLASLPADELVARLEAEVVEFVAGRQRDDLALFAMRAR